jgi:hypothetical protein
MTSEDQNFELYAGESKVITVTVKDDAGALIDGSGGHYHG